MYLAAQLMVVPLFDVAAGIAASLAGLGLGSLALRLGQSPAPCAWGPLGTGAGRLPRWSRV